jgi:hypothetical protein
MAMPNHKRLLIISLSFNTILYNTIVNYSDDEFISAVESCTIDSFHHSDHIRLAWLYCERFGLPEASRRIVETIQRFAAHAGQSDKYHHTMTLAWIRIVDAAQRAGPPSLAAHPGLLDKAALSAYYSPETLSTAQARTTWVQPDRTRLP